MNENSDGIMTMELSQTRSLDNLDKLSSQHVFNIPQNQNNVDNSFLKKGTSLNQNEESAIIKKLETQLKAAQNEIKELREILAKMQPNKAIGIPTSWEEEEEIVAQETSWLLPRNKKRKAVYSPEKDYSDSQTNSKSNTRTTTKNHKPPPVILSNVTNYNKINKELQIKKIKFQTKLLNNNQIKINVDSESEYRDVTALMNSNDIEWHTYENKQTRPIRVMARNLHSSCSPEMIKDELLSRNFQILEVVNKIKKITENNVHKRIPLPLFMLTFKNTEDLKNIYEIKHICGMQVKIEAIKNNKLIPQCKKCQRFGHTQKYCQRPVVCVKCAENHLTTACNKPKGEKPRCSNCGEAHPASYRGCLIAKELQKRRDNIIQSKKTEVGQSKPFTARKISKEIPYAQIAAGKNNAQDTENINLNVQAELVQREEPSLKQMMNDMMKMIGQLSDRLDRLEARSTGTIPRLQSNGSTRP